MARTRRLQLRGQPQTQALLLSLRSLLIPVRGTISAQAYRLAMRFVNHYLQCVSAEVEILDNEPGCLIRLRFSHRTESICNGSPRATTVVD